MIHTHMKDLVSERAGLVDASGIRKVFSLAAKMKDPVNFSIGQPDFDVPEEIKQAAIKAIQDGANKYSQTTGDNILIEKIAGQLEGRFGGKQPGVIVTCGVSGALTLAFMSLINPGDEVIIIDPYFVIYKQMVRMLGGVCVFVDSYPDFKLPLAGIARAISKRTKMIIVNSPCNPTGGVYSGDEAKGLAEIAAKHDVLVVTDEIYERFCYEQDGCASVASFYDNVLLLGGFSKSYAMPGWRIGYAAGAARVAGVIDAMTKIQQYTFVCAPTPFQKAASAALEVDVSVWIAAYRKKRDLLYDGLKDKFELNRPAGAFYAFIKAPWGNGSAFVEKAIGKGVLIIPGSVFSEKDTHFRISYATSDKRIEQGIKILRSLA